MSLRPIFEYVEFRLGKIFTLSSFHFSLYQVPRGQKIIQVRSVIMAGVSACCSFLGGERCGQVLGLFNRKSRPLPTPAGAPEDQHPVLLPTQSSCYWRPQGLAPGSMG